MKQNDVILAITGASGAIYAVRLLQVLLHARRRVHLSISPSGQAVVQQELGLDVALDRFEAEQWRPDMDDMSDAAQLLREVTSRDVLVQGVPTANTSALGGKPGQVVFHNYQNMLAPIASGSFLSGGMVVCPCSGTTLSAIAHSSSGNLIQRAAEVQLKERRKLIVVPRETPVSLLQLENLQRVASAGAVVMPASPGWYHGVSSLADLVDFVVARICDQLEVECSLIKRWGSKEL
ncbi:MAG: UbiX family flavin prenyltransferase [Planctomycetales bacterium]|nr:UbiX family flavin prenyltransferase [Planctomycetales bacterium]